MFEIEGPYRPRKKDRIKGVILAVALGIMFAVSLVHWWTT